MTSVEWKCRPAMALHGGAITATDRDYSRERTHMESLVALARGDLDAGAAALDVAAKLVREMELSGLYVAGRGGFPNAEGRYELDACLVDGHTGRAGAVAALEGFQSPVDVARAVMEETPHVLLVGAGAVSFARSKDFARVPEGDWFTSVARDTVGNAGIRDGLGFGTVGCVVLDRHGDLAAATSTAGVFGKRPGRVGDTPVVGAGTWADKLCAVSCTGLGEYFIRTAAAAQLGFRLRWAGQSLDEAACAVLEEIRVLGGKGGLVSISSSGEIAMPFIANGMKRAALFPDGRSMVEIL